jgi:signal transduction histidine kinase
MFIASMSHELRTPLNSIIGFSGIMLQGMSGEINEEQRDHLERVYRAGKHLLSLITDVIDIAKIESGKIVPYSEEFDLQDIIEEACKSLQVQIDDKGLELTVNVPESPVSMHSDRRRLLQCLLNFLSNAVKFSEKGTVMVTVTEWQSDRVAEAQSALPEGWVEISVSDNGIGISEEDMPMLFQSFVRFDSPLKTTTPGTGLGLYLTKKLAVEVLGGDVGAESRKGMGSRFWIRVPVFLSDKVAK